MLKVENLTASIGDVSILNGIDLEVGPGELHAIMGPNGSGKSTLCHVVMGNKDYSQGGKISIGDGNTSRTSSSSALTSSSMISLQRSTHSSHMYTLGPAINLRTSSWPLPQKVQDNLLLSLFSICTGSSF